MAYITLSSDVQRPRTHKLFLTNAILIHLNRSVIDFRHCLDLYVVAMATGDAFTIQVCVKIFSDIMTKKVSIFSLKIEV